ncbi:hypothetical protein HMPREF1555_01466 [Porphyromonas gingivalis F0570]|uniref:Uncharacterized protein n=1 Tax=Porphyromonas gingivalis F0570 TaxID=1227271 RepID=A0A0E2LPQ1_PORGN|nr:hypothetical protein HMPREF1555_01466 [Porphyromonas gingivalis F0570]
MAGKYSKNHQPWGIEFRIANLLHFGRLRDYLFPKEFSLSGKKNRIISVRLFGRYGIITTFAPG